MRIPHQGTKMMHRGDAVFFYRLQRVLRQQQRIIGCLQRPELSSAERRTIVRFLQELRWLQRAIWNSLAKRRRARLLAAARQVDTLAEQWSSVTRALRVDLGSPADQDEETAGSDLDSAA